MKKYEIALLYESCEYNNVKTYEYNTMAEMQEELTDFILYEKDDLCKIEISVLEQDEDGENINIYTFCEIDMKEYRKGMELWVIK